MRTFVVASILTLACHASPAFAALPACEGGGGPSPLAVRLGPGVQFESPVAARVWRHVFVDDALPPSPTPGLVARAASERSQESTRRTQAVQLSRGYETRLKIHRLASWATAPLFVAQYAVGEKLYDGRGSESLRSAHSALAAGTAVLFGVNTVTGVWNLWEGRHKTEGRTRRWVHSLLMLGADAGFVATGMLAPDDDEHEGGRRGEGRSTHRTVALTSMGVAAASYVYMLFTR